MGKVKFNVRNEGPKEFRGGLVSYERNSSGPKYKVGGWLHAHLPNGSDVFVGVTKEHPQSGLAIIHEFHADQPDGPRTRLHFALSPEAVAAVIALYHAHGMSTKPPTIEKIALDADAPPDAKEE